MKFLIAICLVITAGQVLGEKHGVSKAHDHQPNRHIRNYDAPLTKQEKEDISYIIKYLSDKPTATLLWHKFSLEAAGGRIEHIHPLRFFICVLTDDELAEGLKTIYRNRTSTRGDWVWKDFIGGIKESLKDEYHRGNLRDDQLADFAKIIGIDSHDLFTTVHEKRWNEFVVHLIKKGS